MANNLATKYSSVVDERFKEASLTEAAVNRDYDWDGVASVIVYDVDTSAMNNYTTSGSNRYGTPSELGNGIQTFTIGQDRSFTFTIDRKNNDDAMMVMAAGEALGRQIDEVVTPETDEYRIAKMVLNAGNSDGTAITTANAYSKFLDARANIRKAKVPVNGCIAFVSTNFYKKIKQDSSFVKASDIAQNMLITGQIGRIDNIAVVEVPDSYLLGAEFVITHPVATTACEKLAEYRIHDNAPGISGWLVEGRTRYDAFVRKNKKSAIATQIGAITLESAATGTSTVTTVLDFDGMDTALRAGFEIRYASTASTQKAATVGEDCSTWSALATTAIATTSATYKIAAALCDPTTHVCIVPTTSISPTVYS